MDVTEEYIENNSWMIRPCQLYKEEYSDCTSIRSRFYQYFIFGKFSDCSHWNRDYINCNKWSDSQDKRAFKELIDSEVARKDERLTAHNNNDVWEKRTEPPPGWNDPLPKHIQERVENSYLAHKAKELKEDVVTSEKSYCVIS